MALSAKFIKKQLALFKPLVMAASLDLARRGQNQLGEWRARGTRKKVSVEKISLEKFDAVFCNPKHDSESGVLLYLHGGGYCCGDIRYASGVATHLAMKFGIRVFAPAYRLAPEHPFPSALDDALEAYLYLLSVGYTEKDIVLVGESAGGGLVFSLCLALKERAKAMPAGIVAISPWTDLTASGDSYEENRKKDPSMSPERLDFFASQYTKERENPLVSPLFGNLCGLPPTLIFVGGDEVMLSDSLLMHERLSESGVKSEISVAEGFWHVYLLYGFKENAGDIKKMRAFLHDVLPTPRKLRWMPLDNAAKIYPAARSRTWSNVFRLSATLTEAVDKDILTSALAVTVRRFPMISVKLGTGLFWYYLEEIDGPPEIKEDSPFPLVRMVRKDMKKCAFRVLIYGRRIAVEFFHSLTDGNGGLVFLKTLLAEYLEQKHGLSIPSLDGVLDRRALPDEGEFEDSFLKYSGDIPASRAESTAYHLSGTKSEDGFVHAISFTAKTSEVIALAKAHGVTVTAFLTAALMQAFLEIQSEDEPKRKRRRPVKVLLPVNLRKLFPSESLRNFVLYIIPEIDARLGEYSMEELCRMISHQMGIMLTEKYMASHVATNVMSEKIFIAKIMPLFIKNIVMKLVFRAVGEKKSCLTFSNLGAVKLPEVMQPYVERFDFLLNVPSTLPSNCSAISYGDTLIMSFVRNIEEAKLESHFHAVLRRMGLRMKVESNSGRLM